MRSLPLVLVVGLVACASQHSAPKAASPSGAAAAPSAVSAPGAPGSGGAGASPSAAAMSWMLGRWSCDVAWRPAPGAVESRSHARLTVDAYMDVWVGAGLEPDDPAIPRGDFYFTHDAGLESWALVGFTSDGTRYSLSSPGELDGHVEWVGSSVHGGPPADLHVSWTHQGEGALSIAMVHREPRAGFSLRASCRR